VDNSKTLDIFNYEFDWFQPKNKSCKKELKEVCCEKYKKKKEKHCKSCPEKSS